MLPCLFGFRPTKMCCNISVTKKMQPMPAMSGFPDEWKFTIDPQLPISRNDKYAEAPIVKGLRIFSPSLKRSYYSLAAAYKISSGVKRAIDPSCESFFYKYIGACPGLQELLNECPTLRWSAPPGDLSIDAEGSNGRNHALVSSNVQKNDEFLVGRSLCFEWINLNGHRKGVYGSVTECCSSAHDDDTAMSFTVVFNDRSRMAANAITNGCGSTIPESEIFSAELVIGACLAYEQQVPHEPVERLVDLYSPLPCHQKWILPVSRHEEIITGEDNELLPRLTLIFRGYELVFDTKTSTIPGAGFGVFLSCRPLYDVGNPDDKPTPFRLDNGELLDLGIYAPFRIGDKKPAAVFDVKNFIHSFDCEEFLFGPRESGFQLDITDDVSGKLHEDARKHIPAFVNETADDDKLCVLAEHDAEGSVHYLLGHARTSQGEYTAPADGSQVELFINYGPSYEKVRIRNGFSTLCEEERAPFEEALSNEDVEDIRNMNSFNASEVNDSVNFLVRLFSSSNDGTCKLSSCVKERSLICSAVLQYRAHTLLLNNDEVDKETSSGDLQKLLHNARGLCTLVMINSDQNLSEWKALHASSNVEGLLKSILVQYYTKDKVDMINSVLT